MRTVLLSLAVLALSILGNPVELKDNTPLIDLASSVVDSEKGQGGNEEAGLVNADDSVKVIEAPEDIEIVISVRDREIRVNGEVCDGTARMGDKIKSLYKNGMSMRLVDDYAEYHIYKEVRDKLKELKYSCKEETNE